jgi:mannose-6-phosphate isomerase
MESATTGTQPLYPFVLEPIFKYRIWGGRRLQQVLGKKLPPDEPIGESWEVSCRGEDNNLIRNGALAGKTLADVFHAHKEALVGGSLPAGATFPLLNKFIDAHNLLSVQVHPDEAVAAALGGGAEAKTEAWYVMHAAPGATLIKGLKPGVTREVLEKAIRDDTVPELLASVPVSAGDMVFVPAGCVHAMGKDLIICEIQQNSDTTYRVYDWGRVGPDGKPRQLHVEQALRAINFDDRSPDKVASIRISQGANARTYAMACPYFAIQTLALNEPAAESTRGKRCDSLMFTEGSALIRTRDGMATPASAGDSVLVPACVGDYRIEPTDRCVLVKVFVPDIETDIVQELRSHGIGEEAIRAVIFE